MLKVMLLAIVLVAAAPAAAAQDEAPNYSSGDLFQIKVAKDPVLAGTLSFVTPGLGQVYAEEYGRGIIHFGAAALGGVMLASGLTDELDDESSTRSTATIGAAVILASWIYSIVDAPSAARRYNRDHGVRVVTVAPTSVTGHDVGVRLAVSW